MPAADIGEFIVAAPDSPTLRTPYQAGIYVAGSTDAQDAIQNAIDDLPPAGGTVRILPGNYELKKQSGQAYCVLLTGSNKRIILDQGATLKLADNQFESTAGRVIQVGEDGEITGTTPNAVTKEVNLAVWGSGVIDGNKANLNAKATGLRVRGHTHWFHVGGGLTIQNCESNPFSISGVSLGGDAADYFGKHTVLDGLRVLDSNEGVFYISQRYSTLNHLHVDNIIDQDGFEPISCTHLAMTNSVIRNTKGSALDIFASGAGSTDTYHTYTNCIFGPITTNSNVVAIGVGGVATHSYHILDGCIILMEDAARGIHVGASGAGSSSTLGIAIHNCIIDGTSAASGADGIVIGADATETTLFSNHISNCPGNAIDRTANPTKLHIKNNSGWGNTSPISAGTGTDNILSGNDFTT